MKENQRTRLTKQILKESLIRLMHKKSIHEVSVREICEQAQLNRTTFYKYYNSPYDLLKSMEDEALEQIHHYLEMNQANQEDNQSLFIAIIDYIDKNIDLFRLLMNNTIDSKFAENLLNLPMIQRLLQQKLTSKYASFELDYIYQFVVSGGYSIIKAWINKDHREEPRIIAGIFMKTLQQLLPNVKL